MVFRGEYDPATRGVCRHDSGMTIGTSTAVRGFSLLELLLTITIAALILGLGVPTFAKITARARQSVAVDALFHAVYLARKESIVRRRVVSLCPSFDGQRCAPGTDWSGGFLVFENRDRDEPPQVDDGERDLLPHEAEVTGREHQVVRVGPVKRAVRPASDVEAPKLLHLVGGHQLSLIHI